MKFLLFLRMYPSHTIDTKGIINPLNECEVRRTGFQGVFYFNKIRYV
jgi:hypothetical protein